MTFFCILACTETSDKMHFELTKFFIFHFAVIFGNVKHLSLQITLLVVTNSLSIYIRSICFLIFTSFIFDILHKILLKDQSHIENPLEVLA